MDVPQGTRTTRQKVSIFRKCFAGLTHVYGTYDPKTGRAFQVKRPVTDQVVLRHLQGRRPYGVYLLVDERTRAVVVDFDEEDAGPPVDFIRRARHYGVTAYLERSKRKGWHVWIFLKPPGVSARKARTVVGFVLNEIGCPDTEVFPKQDKLDGQTGYGNFINAPLFGTLVPKGRTVFVDPSTGLKPYADQWALLQSVRCVLQPELDDVIEVNGLAEPCALHSKRAPPPTDSIGQPTSGLLPCARVMLAEGVGEYQRVACFRLALQLKKAGLPEDAAVAVLTNWAAKNRPDRDKRTITHAEIVNQTRAAYQKSYRGCGCEDPAIRPHCRVDCPLRSKTQAGPTRQEPASHANRVDGSITPRRQSR